MTTRAEERAARALAGRLRHRGSGMLADSMINEAADTIERLLITPPVPRYEHGRWVCLIFGFMWGTMLAAALGGWWYR